MFLENGIDSVDLVLVKLLGADDNFAVGSDSVVDKVGIRADSSKSFTGKTVYNGRFLCGIKAFGCDSVSDLGTACKVYVKVEGTDDHRDDSENDDSCRDNEEYLLVLNNFKIEIHNSLPP